jgi:hypothetical protein
VLLGGLLHQLARQRYRHLASVHEHPCLTIQPDLLEPDELFAPVEERLPASFPEPQGGS